MNGFTLRGLGFSVHPSTGSGFTTNGFRDTASGGKDSIDHTINFKPSIADNVSARWSLSPDKPILRVCPQGLFS